MIQSRCCCSLLLVRFEPKFRRCPRDNAAATNSLRSALKLLHDPCSQEKGLVWAATKMRIQAWSWSFFMRACRRIKKQLGRYRINARVKKLSSKQTNSLSLHEEISASISSSVMDLNWNTSIPCEQLRRNFLTQHSCSLFHGLVEAPTSNSTII